MKILFISRAYPPVIGGIEKQNYEISHALSELSEIKIIANTRGKRVLPFFLIFAFLKSVIIAHQYDVILLGDGVLGLPGWLLKVVTKKPVVSIIHGLDITFNNSLYQSIWVRFALKRLDALFAVGNETIRQAVVRGIKQKKCVFIPNGVEVFDRTLEQLQARELLGLNSEGIYLLTLGRLVRRKGVAWFVREVVGKLDDVTYLVAGDGQDRLEIEKAIEETGLQARVLLLGSVSSGQKSALLQAVDVFVQPNIAVEGDMEGFGLVVLEAAAAGLPVVASRLEGLCDAIHHEENGVLVEPEHADGYIERISQLLNDERQRTSLSLRAKDYVESNCLWSHIAKQYHEELVALLDI